MHSKKRHILLFWFPIAAYVGLILLGSFIPGLLIPLPRVAHADKWAHLIEYSILALLVARAFVASLPDRSILVRCLIAIGCVTLIGALDEATQSLTPHRHPDVNDLLADVAGALLGTALYIAILKVGSCRQQATTTAQNQQEA